MRNIFKKKFISYHNGIESLQGEEEISGSVYKEWRKKKLRELGSDPSHTKLAARKVQSSRVIGGNRKLRMLSCDTANLYDPKSKSSKMAKIKTIVENPANSNFIRRNIMTKGAIIDTEFGRARITSRPGQHGTVNAVLI